MIKRWLLFWVCVLLVAGSGVGGLVTLDQRAYATRGWENATDTLELPSRLPLAGVNVDLQQYSPEELFTQLDRIATAGFTWVRQSFLWQDIEPEPGQYHWDTYDAIVAAVKAHETLQLVAVLDGTPPWARHPLAPGHPFAPPASVGDYARFAGALAARYRDSITYYQIWDEPNIRSHWGGMDPEPAHYVAMLREVCGRGLPGSYQPLARTKSCIRRVSSVRSISTHPRDQALAGVLYHLDRAGDRFEEG